MSDPLRAVCLHAHFYQPPREDPWLGTVPPEPSAAPDRDWNARITRECYAPHGAARLLNGSGRLVDVVNLYESISFNVGPTLASWLEAHAPRVLALMRAGDAASVARTGCGNAWAQAWGHAILPLSSREDIATQVAWGVADFRYRFGRPAEGMWLPEMAVDVTTLEALAAAGVSMTVLAPHQIARIRPRGEAAAPWRPVAAEAIDVRRLYRCVLPSGRAIDIVLRHAELSRDLAFGALLRDGAELTARLRALAHDGEGSSIVAAATDGETFGHHHRHGEMAIAFAMRALARDGDVAVLGPAAYRLRVPPRDDVEIVDGSSWSCAHGIERWRADCGCRIGGSIGSQAWRSPLRTAIDWLRDEAATTFVRAGGAVLRDPWGARDRYIECLLSADRWPAFLAAEACASQDRGAERRVREVLELGRHALMMQTSCGWFFDELGGIEPAIIMRHAARVIELAGRMGARLESGFLDRLRPARDERHGLDGTAVFRRAAESPRVTADTVAATSALMRALDTPGDVPGYAVTSAPAAEGTVQVTERATGASWPVYVRVGRDPQGGLVATTAGGSLRIAEVFPVARERVAAAVTRRVDDALRAARASSLGHDDATVRLLIAAAGALSDNLAHVLVPYLIDRLDAVDPAAREWARAVAGLGGIDRRALTVASERRLDLAAVALPGAAALAHLVLDVVEIIGLTPDTTRAQVAAFSWWAAHGDPERCPPETRRLLERLGVETQGA